MTTQGRKPTPAATAVPVKVNHALLAQDNTAADQLLEMKAGYAEERDLANQLLGQIQMARAFAKFTDVVGLSKLKVIKENKIYRAVAGQKGIDSAGNEITDVGTWDGFCRALGTSQQKVDEDLLNLNTFGEEALEQMQRIGMGYRELRQYRRLPEDQKLALIEVAKAGDKEGFVELAEEIIAKHAKEKETAAENLEAKDQVLAKANERINSLEDQVARKFKPRADSIAKTGQEQAQLDELHEATLAAQLATRRLFEVVDTMLDGSARDALEMAARQAVEYLAQQFVDIATEFNVAVDFEERIKPTWASDAMLAAMEARIQEADAKDKGRAKPKAAALQSVGK